MVDCHACELWWRRVCSAHTYTCWALNTCSTFWCWAQNWWRIGRPSISVNVWSGLSLINIFQSYPPHSSYPHYTPYNHSKDSHYYSTQPLVHVSTSSSGAFWALPYLSSHSNQHINSVENIYILLYICILYWPYLSTHVYRRSNTC